MGCRHDLMRIMYIMLNYLMLYLPLGRGSMRG